MMIDLLVLDAYNDKHVRDATTRIDIFYILKIISTNSFLWQYQALISVCIGIQLAISYMQGS